jgi:hypothetical protein
VAITVHRHAVAPPAEDAPINEVAQPVERVCSVDSSEIAEVSRFSITTMTIISTVPSLHLRVPHTDSWTNITMVIHLVTQTNSGKRN